MSFEGVHRVAPPPDASFTAYWDGVREGVIVLWRCADCQYTQVFPPDLCRSCHGSKLDRVEASGRATLYTYTVVWRAPSLSWASAVPYAIALVDLAEGPRLMTNLVDCAPADISIGMPVEVRFDRIDDSFSLPVFHPAAAP
jgi:uncharacterized protein